MSPDHSKCFESRINKDLLHSVRRHELLKGLGGPLIKRSPCIFFIKTKAFFGYFDQTTNIAIIRNRQKELPSFLKNLEDLLGCDPLIGDMFETVDAKYIIKRTCLH